MRFLSYYPRAMSDASGVTAALWAWAHNLALAGHEVVVLHAGGPGHDAPPAPWPAGLSDHLVRHRGRGRTTHRPIGLDGLLRPHDVLVLHEGWVLSNHLAARAARQAGIPYIIVPHGAYEPEIVRSIRQPRLIRIRLERRLVERAALVHVFFGSETATVASLAPAARFVVAATGVDVPAYRWSGGGGYLSWIGRYDPRHKGLDVLIEAIAALPPHRRPRLEMRGPDFRGGHAVVRSLIDRLDLADCVRALGPVSGAEKLAFLAAAEGYIHPSRWESHSIALLENLALGVPTLVSNTIHIAADLAAADAAVLAPPTVAGLADGLDRLRSAGPELGARGRDFVDRSLSWRRAVSDFVAGVQQVVP